MIRTLLLALTLLGGPLALAADLEPGGAAGELAPVFTAVDQKGESVDLAALRAKGPVILVFYRGFW